MVSPPLTKYLAGVSRGKIIPDKKRETSLKMKVKVLSRNPEDHIRQRKSDIHKLHRNFDPSLHPFEAPREYTRALNATKLERVFAKPFVGALDGHTDGVNCIARHPRSLSVLLSGSCDGEVSGVLDILVVKF